MRNYGSERSSSQNIEHLNVLEPPSFTFNSAAIVKNQYLDLINVPTEEESRIPDPGIKILHCFSKSVTIIGKSIFCIAILLPTTISTLSMTKELINGLQENEKARLGYNLSIRCELSCLCKYQKQKYCNLLNSGISSHDITKMCFSQFSGLCFPFLDYPMK